MLHGGERRRRQADHHHRGPRQQRPPAQGAAGLDRRRRAAMRLLPERHDHGGGGAPQGEAEADRRRHRQRDHQHLPLRHLSAGARRHPRRRGERLSGEDAMNYMPKIDRRSFLVSTAGAAGGLALGFTLPFGAAEALESGPEVNAWVVIKPNETVVIRIARSEMGQGTLTGLAQLVAEELECDWSKVTYEFPTPGQNVARKRVWNDFFTAGSRGIRESNKFLREGGAAARMMLVSAAADELKVPASELTAANGVVTHKASGRQISYGKLAPAAGKLEPPKDIKLKDFKDWKVIGQGKKRLDTPVKVTGEAQYGIDMRLPDMLYAAIKSCPVNGGTLASYDESKIASKPGVKKVVKVENNAVVVIADSWWRAKTALDALPIKWDEGPNAKVSSASIAAWLKEGLDGDAPLVGNKTGDAKAALDGAAKKVEAVYAYPYQHHVTMEPQNATARYTADKCEVWTSTQNGEAALALVSETSGLPIPKCEV